MFLGFVGVKVGLFPFDKFKLAVKGTTSFLVSGTTGVGFLVPLVTSLLIPAIVGQNIGTKIRHKMSNEIFKRIILYILVILGLMLLIKNI